MAHLRARRLLLVLAAASVALPAATPDIAGASAPGRGDAAGQAYQDLGCYPDEVDDADDPRADIVELCVNYQGELLGFVLQPAQPSDPAEDAAWASPETFALVEVDTDGDGDVDRRIVYDGDGAGTITGHVEDADGTPVCTVPEVTFTGRHYIARTTAECLGDPDAVHASGLLSYDDGGGAATDTAPDAGLEGPLTNAPPPDEQCQDAGEDDDGRVVILRVRCGVGGTEPISQAVAVSEFAFSDALTARWAVIARNDDFADALAGSALGFGQGPLLFTYSPASSPAGHDPGTLAPNTKQELLRVLPRGSTVYLLGGGAALDPGLDAELEAAGYRPVRYAGVGREDTARIISAEVRRLVEGFVERNAFPDKLSVLVTTRSNWPDAVMAGSVAAYWGMPILLTPTDFLHPDTIAALEDIQPEFIYVIGGSAVVSRDVLRSLQDYASGGPSGSFCDVADDPATPEDETRTFVACRWAGQDRVITAQAVGELNRSLLERYQDNGLGNLPEDAVFAAAVNVFRPDGYAHALSASAISGRFGGAVFIPLRGDTGDTIDDGIRFWLCEFLPDMDFLLLMGDTDIVQDAAAQQIRDAIASGCGG